MNPAPTRDEIDALKLAIGHIEHMAAWIGKQNTGYSFEALGEDMPTIKDALRLAAEKAKAGPSIDPLLSASRALLDAVTHDDSGTAGRGGNGGLISRETIRKADELRLVLDAAERAKEGDHG